jgi:hypothetical protein
VAYHGPPDQLNHYFSVHDTEEVYPKLATQTSERWQSSWMKHRGPYYSKLERNRTKLVDSGGLHLPADPEPVPTEEIETEKESEKEKPQPD